MSKPSMPTALVVVLVFMGLSVALDITLALMGEGGIKPWVRPVLTIALMVGLIRGREGARALLRGLAFLGLIISAIAVAMAADVLSNLGMLGSLGVVTMGALGFGIVSCVMMIWGLGRDDVKDWMSQKRIAEFERNSAMG